MPPNRHFAFGICHFALKKRAKRVLSYVLPSRNARSFRERDG